MSGWAIKWRTRPYGEHDHLLGRFGFRGASTPVHLRGYTKMVFETRQEAREHIKEHYACMRRHPPHGWRMPIPVKVSVTVAEAGGAA